jgi:hypothetical protein
MSAFQLSAFQLSAFRVSALIGFLMPIGIAAVFALK